MHQKQGSTVIVTIHVHCYYNHAYMTNGMQNILGNIFVRPAISRSYRYQEEDPLMNVAYMIYPAYHEEDPPASSTPFLSAAAVCSVLGGGLKRAPTATALLYRLDAMLDFSERYDLVPSDSIVNGTYNEGRLVQSVSVEAINSIMSSEPTTPLKSAQSVDRVDLASSTSPMADLGLKQAQSMDAVNKAPGLRRNNFSFEDKWLAHLTSHASDVMDFGDEDTWSQVSYESSLASATDGGPSRSERPALPASALSRRYSAGDKLDLQSASRRGLSHSMILTWLSHKRYVPATEPISEGAVDAAGPNEAAAPASGGDTTISTSGTNATTVGISGANIPKIPITGTGLTATATAMVNAGDVTKGKIQDKKASKINYRELNAYSPSAW